MNYNHVLLLKLNKLRGLYLRKKNKINKKYEEKLISLHVPKVVEFYEINKSKELLYYLLKSKQSFSIDTILEHAHYIANQPSSSRRKLLADACLKGLGNDYSALYVISNQTSEKDMKRLINIYFSNKIDREKVLTLEKQKTLNKIYKK